MTWDRKTITAVVIVMVSVAFAAFMFKWTSDNDGETITIGGDPVASSSAPPPSSDGPDDQIRTGDVDSESGLLWIEEEDLPVEAQATLAIIEQGGPFPFPNDGTTFGNFEGLLPEQARGYYREYTVITSGSPGRGARRIVTGSGGEFYWTQDHYVSFERILRRGA